MLCILLGGISDCGASLHSDKQPIAIFTNPPESTVVTDDYLHLIAPGTITLSRIDNHLAQVNKDD